MTKDEIFLKEAKKYFICILEKFFQLRPREKLALFFDLNGAGNNNADIGFVKFIISCFTSYFPNILAYILIIDLPWILNTLWYIIKAFLSAKQQSFVKVVKKKDLFSYIDKKSLLEHLGGELKLSQCKGPNFSDKKKTNDNNDDNYDEEKYKIIKTDITPNKNNLFQSFHKYGIIQKNSNEDPSLSIYSHTENFDMIGEDTKTKDSHGSTIGSVKLSEENLIFNDDNKFSSNVFIINKSKYHVAFKIRSTNPTCYKVIPYTGIINSNFRAEVNFYPIMAKIKNMEQKDVFQFSLLLIKEKEILYSNKYVSNIFLSYSKNPANEEEGEIKDDQFAVYKVYSSFDKKQSKTKRFFGALSSKRRKNNSKENEINKKKTNKSDDDLMEKKNNMVEKDIKNNDMNIEDLEDNEHLEQILNNNNRVVENNEILKSIRKFQIFILIILIIIIIRLFIYFI